MRQTYSTEDKDLYGMIEEGQEGVINQLFIKET